LIIHAGDIGSPQVLKELEAIAPVLAIKGNNDRDAWARRLPEVVSVGVNASTIYVIHNVHELNLNTGAHKVKIVVSGHSHHPSVALREGILFINPGSAGPRRFKLPVSVARLKLGDKPRVKIVELKI
jgi:putative phosphoesterase